VQPIADEAVGEGWKALIFDGRIILAVDPDGDVLPRALRELLTPVEMYHWDADWQHEDRAGWDIYHVCKII
jgi:hypothetical protein